jgi:hypothetical protein
MDFYTYNFLLFVLINGALSCAQLNRNRGFWGKWNGYVPLQKLEAHQASNTTFADFRKKYMLVYLLVFAADWLQVYLSVSFVCSHYLNSIRVLTYTLFIKVQSGHRLCA